MTARETGERGNGAGGSHARKRIAGPWMTALGVIAVLAVVGCEASPWADDAAKPPGLDGAHVGAEVVEIDATDDSPVGGDPAAPAVAAWERYLRFHTELRGPSPSGEALDIHAYSLGDARFVLAHTATSIAFRGGALVLVVTSESPEVTFSGEGSAEIATCIVEEVPAHWVDGALVEARLTRRAAWARVARVDTAWLVEDVDFERGPC